MAPPEPVLWLSVKLTFTASREASEAMVRAPPPEVPALLPGKVEPVSSMTASELA